jgi:hypothetical protein
MTASCPWLPASQLRLPIPSAYCFSFGILLTYEDAARARITENTYHVTATQLVHWGAGCCLQNTRHVTATHCCGVVIATTRKCLPSRWLEAGCITPLSYCYVFDSACCGRCLAMDLHVTIIMKKILKIIRWGVVLIHLTHDRGQLGLFSTWHWKFRLYERLGNILSDWFSGRTKIHGVCQLV